MASASHGSCRGTFLSLMGAVYFCAFVSYYLQYPGLLGEDGLLPASRYWKEVRGSRLKQAEKQGTRPLELDLDTALGWWTRGVAGGIVSAPKLQLAGPGQAVGLRGFLGFPTLLWFLAEEGGGPLQVDQALEGLSLAGAALAALAVLGVHNVAVFALLYLCYLSLYLLGQTWLGFQWDIFLLETGALMLVYCPVLSWRAGGANPPGAWLLRALIVKFMYMNGVVKVNAQCPTWKYLTALEYHFASTCLPTSEAWALHQLPPVVLRLGVAAMFVVELVAPWLLLCPARAARRVGVMVQAPLQLGILATGNYNWFNLHTLVLLLPAWDSDDYDDLVDRSRLVERLTTGPVAAAVALGACGLIGRASSTMFEIHSVGAGGSALGLREVLSQGLASLSHSPAALGRGLRDLFNEDRLAVKSLFANAEVTQISELALSASAIHALFALVALSCLRYAAGPLCRTRSARGAAAAVPALVERLLVGAMTLPLLTICLLPLEHIHRGARAAVPYAKAARPLESVLDPWHVSTSYGLFRRMTGVGPAPAGAHQGWGGLPPSVVEVPAVVVEASKDGSTWTEIPFRYAPGNVSKQPRRTAPHQPRLDWQMWFAALGSYQHNPWFVHFLYKILEGSQPVMDLLDVEQSLWTSDSDPPQYVRAWLYHYDFTRLDTPWARTVPGVRVLDAAPGAAGADEWWTRKKVRPYIQQVTSADLRQALSSQGWPTSRSARAKATRRSRNCTSAVQRHRAWGIWCTTVVKARELAEPLQRRSGWPVHTDVFRLFWPGASGVVFVDVHFVAILSPLLGLLVARLALAACCGRGSADAA